MVASLAARGADVTALSRKDGLDLTDAASVRRAFSGLEGMYDRIVLATGLLAPTGAKPEKSLAAIDAAHMAQVMAINAIAPALVMREVPRLIPRNSRSVVAVLTARVGSIGDNRMGGWYSYRASKAAANQIVRTAAIEIGRKYRHAIVAALHPGTVDTPFTRGYPAHKKVSAADAAVNLISVMDNLTADQTGGFFDWAGEVVPW